MIVQRERSLFRDSTEVLDAVFTFFADIHAVGLLKSEVFSHWTAEVASIPSDVDQAYFSMVALTRGISYQGNRFSKETYVRIMDGVNTQFNLKRKGKNVFLTSAVRFPVQFRIDQLVDVELYRRRNHSVVSSTLL